MTNLICEIAKTTWYWDWETNFILFLQSLGGENSFFYWMFHFFTLFGEEYFVVAIIGIIYWGIDREIGEKIGFSVLTVNVINPLIKNVFTRVRPFLSTETNVLCYKKIDGFSFPSGHSSLSSTLYLNVFWQFKDSKPKKLLLSLAIIIPTLVALSRCYLGVHWPTDVFAGLILGLLTLLLVNLLLSKIKNKHLVYAIFLAISTLGVFYCQTNDYFTTYGMLLGFVLASLVQHKLPSCEVTDKWWMLLLRVAIAVSIYFGLNELIKLIGGFFIDIEALDAPQFALRTFRYALIMFVVFGLTPLFFNPLDKLLIKNKKQ